MRTEKLHIFLDQLQGEKITCIRREAIRLWIGIGDTIERLKWSYVYNVRGKL